MPHWPLLPQAQLHLRFGAAHGGTQERWPRRAENECHDQGYAHSRLCVWPRSRRSGRIHTWNELRIRGRRHHLPGVAVTKGERHLAVVALGPRGHGILRSALWGEVDRDLGHARAGARSLQVPPGLPIVCDKSRESIAPSLVVEAALIFHEEIKLELLTGANNGELVRRTFRDVPHASKRSVLLPVVGVLPGAGAVGVGAGNTAQQQSGLHHPRGPVPPSACRPRSRQVAPTSLLIGSICACRVRAEVRASRSSYLPLAEASARRGLADQKPGRTVPMPPSASLPLPASSKAKKERVSWWLIVKLLWRSWVPHSCAFC